MLAEYKAFLLRGNLLDLAVAFVLGAAFNAVVSALANDVIMGAVAGLLDLEGVEQLRWGPVHIGSFLAALISFVVVATVLFVIIRAARTFERPGIGGGPHAGVRRGRPAARDPRRAAGPPRRALEATGLTTGARCARRRPHDADGPSPPGRALDPAPRRRGARPGRGRRRGAGRRRAAAPGR